MEQKPIMVQKINSSIRHISKIFNIADCHIRLFKRRTEYLKVFDNLYNEISKGFDNESIIVVVGDIIHTKLEISAEMIDMVSNFLKALADIGPTIVVPGNHDCSLNNLQRMDALSPIIKILNHSNIFYLKKTGLYEMGDNVIISNMSIFDESDKYIKARDIPKTDREKIAIFHGTINGAFTDTNFQLNNGKIGTDLFDGFDSVLIGDIHKMQIVQEYKVEELEIDEDNLEKYLENGWEVA